MNYKKAKNKIDIFFKKTSADEIVNMLNDDNNNVNVVDKRNEQFNNKNEVNWYVGGSYDLKGKDPHINIIEKNHVVSTVLINHSDLPDLSQAEATAEFICKAVNNHSILLEALQSILQLCDGANLSSFNQMKEAVKGSIELADEAIQKCEQ